MAMASRTRPTQYGNNTGTQTLSVVSTTAEPSTLNYRFGIEWHSRFTRSCCCFCVLKEEKTTGIESPLAERLRLSAISIQERSGVEKEGVNWSATGAIKFSGKLSVNKVACARKGESIVALLLDRYWLRFAGATLELPVATSTRRLLLCLERNLSISFATKMEDPR